MYWQKIVARRDDRLWDDSQHLNESLYPRKHCGLALLRRAVDLCDGEWKRVACWRKRCFGQEGHDCRASNGISRSVEPAIIRAN